MNIFDSKEFQDNILDQVNAMNKLQVEALELQDNILDKVNSLNKLLVEAFNAGYKQGFIDGKNAELDKQMKDQAETTESKVSAELLNERE